MLVTQSALVDADKFPGYYQVDIMQLYYIKLILSWYYQVDSWYYQVEIIKLIVDMILYQLDIIWFEVIIDQFDSIDYQINNIKNIFINNNCQ